MVLSIAFDYFSGIKCSYLGVGMIAAFIYSIVYKLSDQNYFEPLNLKREP
jgi:hypothetical protein